MKILVTGHNGYIGSVMVPMLQAAGYDVVGLDSYYYEECTFGPATTDVKSIRKDLRDVQVQDLAGFDAVIHLAALSNDPLGNLSGGLTENINYRASVRLARLAKQAGVTRFLFSSSCSLYGVAGDDFLAEDAAFNPQTAYGLSKVQVEQEVTKLADESFTPVYLRNATAYGVSPRLRGDVVVNNLVAYAFTSGEVVILSDGTPWRPLVHVEDICQAFICLLEAPKRVVHDQSFNVGSTRENYQVRQIAEMVKAAVPGSSVKYGGANADSRCYRVSCDKLPAMVPDFKPKWSLGAGIEQLYQAYKKHGMSSADFLGARYQRIKTIQKLQTEGRLDSDLRWTARAIPVGQTLKSA